MTSAPPTRLLRNPLYTAFALRGTPAARLSPAERVTTGGNVRVPEGSGPPLEKSLAAPRVVRRIIALRCQPPRLARSNASPGRIRHCNPYGRLAHGTPSALCRPVDVPVACRCRGARRRLGRGGRGVRRQGEAHPCHLRHRHRRRHRRHVGAVGHPEIARVRRQTRRRRRGQDRVPRQTAGQVAPDCGADRHPRRHGRRQQRRRGAPGRLGQGLSPRGLPRHRAPGRHRGDDQDHHGSRGAHHDHRYRPGAEPGSGPGARTEDRRPSPLLRHARQRPQRL